MDDILRFPDKSETAAMEIRPIPLTGRIVQLQPLHSVHIGDLDDAAKDRSIFDLFMDGWIITRFGIPTYVYKLLEEQDDGISLPFSVYHQSLRRIIGITRFYNIERRSRTLEIATWFGKEFQRTGANRESKFLLLRHAFEFLPCLRVGFAIDVRNEPSIRAVEEIGATKEGNRRNDVVLANGESRTSAVYSIIRSEWDAVRVKLEALLSKDYPETG